MAKKEELIRKGLLVGVGIAAYAQDKTEKFVKELTRKGHLDKTKGKKLVKSIYLEADRSRKRMVKVIEGELKTLLASSKVAAKKPAKKRARKKTTRKKAVRRKAGKKSPRKKRRR